jgi:hypothetical protein
MHFNKLLAQLARPTYTLKQALLIKIAGLGTIGYRASASLSKAAMLEDES